MGWGGGEEKGLAGSMGRGKAGGDEKRRIHILKHFTLDLGWNACQIRKTSLVYFTNPCKKDGNEDFDPWEGN